MRRFCLLPSAPVQPVFVRLPRPKAPPLPYPRDGAYYQGDWRPQPVQSTSTYYATYPAECYAEDSTYSVEDSSCVIKSSYGEEGGPVPVTYAPLCVYRRTPVGRFGLTRSVPTTATYDKVKTPADKTKVTDDKAKAPDDKNKGPDDKNKALDDKNKGPDDKNKVPVDKNKADDKDKAADDPAAENQPPKMEAENKNHTGEGAKGVPSPSLSSQGTNVDYNADNKVDTGPSPDDSASIDNSHRPPKSKNAQSQKLAPRKPKPGILSAPPAEPVKAPDKSDTQLKNDLEQVHAEKMVMEKGGLVMQEFKSSSLSFLGNMVKGTPHEDLEIANQKNNNSTQVEQVAESQTQQQGQEEKELKERKVSVPYSQMYKNEGVSALYGKPAHHPPPASKPLDKIKNLICCCFAKPKQNMKSLDHKDQSKPQPSKGVNPEEKKPSECQMDEVSQGGEEDEDREKGNKSDVSSEESDVESSADSEETEEEALAEDVGEEDF